MGKRFVSVCSGIEAASVAWGLLGWECELLSEIDPFASAVLAHHYPGVRNAGDFTRIDAGDVRGRPDLLVGGTPCQDFSVAGLRAGLGGDRGNLTLEFLRLIGRLRPTWVVWENVPGVLSIDRGRAFGAFLGGLGQLGYGFAYRVLDAQHFGVPQRRRRVFVVGHLGDWRRAAAVLLERDCLSGNPPPRRQARSVLASSLTRSLGSGGPDAARAQANHLIPDTSTTVRGHMGRGVDSDCTMTLIPTPSGGVARPLTASMQRYDGETEELIVDARVAHTLRGEGFDASEDGTGRGTPLVAVQAFSCKDSAADTGEIAPTLRAMSGKYANAGGQMAVAYQQHGTNVGEMGVIRKGNGGVTGGVPFIVNAAESCATRSHARPTEVARCIDSTGSFANAQGGTVVMQPFNIIGLGQEGKNHAYATEVSGCLQHKGLAATGNEAGTLILQAEEVTSADHPAIAFQERGREAGRTLEHSIDLAYSMNAPAGGGRRHEMNIAARSAVRRLTPRECEKLQGFPCDYTLVPYRGKPASDGPRYKAIGNSMAVPVMAWIGRRIEMVDSVAPLAMPIPT